MKDPCAMRQHALRPGIHPLCASPYARVRHAAATVPQIFSTLLRVLTGGRGVKVHEGAMLAMGVFITALGEQFMKYMQEFYPYLRLGLQNHQEWQVRE